MTGQRSANSVTSQCFVQPSVHLPSHMFNKTLVLALLCYFYWLFIGVNSMQRETYTRCPLLDMGREYAAYLHLKPYTQNQLFLDRPQKWHFSTVIINDLSGWNFTDKLWGHPRPILHFVDNNRCPIQPKMMTSQNIFIHTSGIYHTKCYYNIQLNSNSVQFILL